MPTVGVKRELLFKALGKSYSKCGFRFKTFFFTISCGNTTKLTRFPSRWRWIRRPLFCFWTRAGRSRKYKPILTKYLYIGTYLSLFLPWFSFLYSLWTASSDNEIHTNKYPNLGRYINVDQPKNFWMLHIDSCAGLLQSILVNQEYCHNTAIYLLTCCRM